MLDEFLEYPDTSDGFVSANEIQHAKDHFEAVLDMLYKKKSIQEMHAHLEEIAAVLGLEDELKELDEGNNQ
jgi:hypothetical protein